ncbi:hypothetical protein [Caballeronia sp. LZ001]|uniref:hypothetical protein n=1 Tax=Caballeronia sp. LZ001 TaxID=3038553 RepID=UPI00285DCA46|nr:hypothetical protein [Caballeronia sp. LZ001]MDR5806326.1 hypothetical protein [Caballeronia sp. LZ001]
MLKSVAHGADNQSKRRTDLETYVGKPLSRNPLALATVYKDGLGRLWRNQTEAAESLAGFGVKREDVNRALRVAGMPAIVLLLFTETGLIGRAARELIRIERGIGREALEQRARGIGKEGKSWSEIINALEDKPPQPPARGRTPQVDLPFVRARQFVEGVTANKWQTKADAAKQQGWGKQRLSNATALSKLPAVITGLFDEKRFSHGNAETLLALVRMLGVSKVARNAKLLSEQPARRSSAAILSYLAGGPADTDCKVEVRVVGDAVTFSFSFKAHSTRRDLIDVDHLRALAAALVNSIEIMQ